jgi:Leucine-rich repeat (LRR) protein
MNGVGIRRTAQAENSGEAPARAVTLNLHGKNIGSMDGLSPCVKLRQLDLSFNQVERIQGCASPPLPRLCCRGCARRTAIDWLPRNRPYDLRTTPATCDMPAPRKLVKPKHGDVLRACQGDTLGASDGVALGAIEGVGCTGTLKVRRLSGACACARVCRLEGCVELRDVQLYNNMVEVVQGLKRCSALHTLNLANNRVVSMRDLEEQLPRGIRWLSLASNRLVAIEGLAHLTSLIHVDLSYNELDSIKGLSTLTALEELKLK